VPFDHAKYFPHLEDEGFTYESDPTPSYNCFAYAAGDTSRKWSPVDEDHYWPSDLPKDTSVEAFVRLFESLEYSVCDSEAYEAGFEKIALYADRHGETQHAARQIDPGIWVSKVGDLDDIHHTLDGLVGFEYGSVVRLLKRRVA
jgi:hypothetical protein